MKGYYFVLLIFALSGCGPAPEQVFRDWRFYNLKGRVKAVTNRTYNRFDEIEKEWAVTDTSDWYIRYRYGFSPDGAIVESEVEVAARERSALPQYYRTVYSHNSFTSLSSKEYDRDSIAIRSSIYSWSGDRRVVRKQYGKDGRLMLLEETSLTKNLHSEIMVLKVFHADTLKEHTQQRYSYDNNNLLVRIENKDMATKETTVYNFKYADFDKTGNPRVTLRYTDGKEKPDRIVMREISYY